MVASFDAFMDALLPKEMIKSRVIKICSDETLNLDELSVKLAQCGYDREIEVAGTGAVCGPWRHLGCISADGGAPG